MMTTTFVSSRQPMGSLATAALVAGLLFIATPSALFSFTIGGRAVDRHGYGISGVVVTVVKGDSPYEKGLRILSTNRGATTPEVSSKTDIDGYFQVKVHTHGMWRVILEKSGFLPVSYPLFPLFSDVELPDVALDEDVGCRVKLVVPQSARTSPVWVATREDITRLLVTSWLPWRPVASLPPDHEEAIPRRADERLVIEAFSPSFEGQAVPCSETASIAMRPRIESLKAMEILDSEGRPVRGALVMVGAARWLLGTTDDDGKLVAPASLLENAHLLTRNGGVLRLTFSEDGASPRASQAQRISGRVLAQETGRPIGDALVWLSSPTSRARRHREAPVSVPSDNLGRFSIVLPADEEGLHLWVAAPEFAPEMVTLGGKPQLEVELEPARRMAGVVVTEDGDPVSGAKVSVAVPRAGLSGEIWPHGDIQTRSDQEGRFLIAQTPNKVDFTIGASRPGFLDSSVSVRTTAENEPIRIVLRRGLTLDGRVVDAQRRPVAEAQVVLARMRAARTRLGPIERWDTQNLSSEILSTGQDGRFAFSNVERSKLALVIQASGFQLETRQLPTTPGQSDSPRHLGDIQLQPGLTVEGLVTDEDQLPIEQPSVLVAKSLDVQEIANPRLARGRYTPTTVLSGGRFVIPNLASGERFDLRIQHSGYVPASRLGVQAPLESPLVVVLERTASLSGKIRDEQKNAVPRALVVARSDGVSHGDRMERATRADDEGHFTISDLKPGRVLLEIRAGGFDKGLEVFDLDADRPLEVEIVLPAPRGHVEGRVTYNEQPLEGALIHIRRREPLVSDQDGYFATREATGQVQVQVQHRDFDYQLSLTRDIKPGRNYIQVEFQRRVVEGHVVSSKGDLLPGVELTIKPISKDRFEKTTSDGNGYFRFEVAAAKYELIARKPGLSARPRSIDLRSDDLNDVVVEMLGLGSVQGFVRGLSVQELADTTILVRPELFSEPIRLYPDSSGGYRARSLGKGTWIVTVVVEGTGRRADASVDLEAGQHERLDVEFVEGLSLSGRIAMDGEPAPSLPVLLLGGELPVRATLTDHTARFRLENIEQGEYQLVAANKVTSVSLQQDKVVNLEVETGSLSGVVTDARTGQPLAGTEVTLIPGFLTLGDVGVSLFGRQAVTDRGGLFVYSTVPEGSYNLRVVGPGYRETYSTIWSEPGQTVHVEMSLIPE